MDLLVDRLHEIGVGPIANFADVFEFQQVAGGRAIEDDVVEILDRKQVAVVLNNNRIGVGLITRRWRTTNQPTHGNTVL